MINISESITIQKPIAEVFAYASNQCNLPEWRKWVTCVEGHDGPLLKGALYVNTPTILGRVVKTEVVIEDVVPDTSYGMHSNDGPLKMHMHMRFEPSGTGTNVSTHLQAEADGVLKLFQGAVGRELRAKVHADGLTLRHILEQGM